MDDEINDFIEIKCYVEGCIFKPIAGSPTPNGYRHACRKHFMEYIERLKEEQSQEN